MNDNSLPRFLARGEELTLSAGTPVWDGSRGDPRVCYVIEGRIHYCLDHPTVEYSLRYGPGSVFGIVDTYGPDKGPVFFWARALTDSRLYCWDRSQFEMALGLYQELANEVIQALSSRLRGVNTIVKGAVGSV